MSIVNFTIDWYKGEIFEALIILGYGLLLIIIALVFLKWGNTSGTEALVVPLISVGVVLGSIGGYNAYSNQNKVYQIEERRIENEMEFIQSEKQRVEEFQYLYMFTKYLATGLFSAAILIFFFLENKLWQSIAISLIILGGTGLVIDYFSKERADIYYQHIINALKL